MRRSWCAKAVIRLCVYVDVAARVSESMAGDGLLGAGVAEECASMCCSALGFRSLCCSNHRSS